MNFLVLGQYAAAFIAVASAIGLVVKWAVLKPLKIYIDQATYPIQPNSNGGKSLPDLINSVDEVKTLLNRHILEHDTPKK